MASPWKSNRRTVRFSTTPPKKEVEVLTDSSLVTLARHIAPEKFNGLILAMMLNISTRTIINCIYDIANNGLREDDEASKTAVAEKCVLLWKEMTADVKTKDRVKYMERALREMGQNDVADVFVDRHATNTEITNDAFA